MIAFLCALPQEAAALRRLAIVKNGFAQVRRTGPGQARAAGVADDLLRTSRPDMVIAAGIAGALDPALSVGDVIAFDTVLDRTSRTSFRSRPPVELQRRPGCTLLTSPRIVAGAEEKRRLAIEFNAIAVDMESAAIARVCAERDVKFAVIRAISDTACESIPEQVVQLFDATGALRVSRVPAVLLSSPRILWRLKQQTDAAVVSLYDFIEAIPANVWQPAQP